MAAFIFGEAVSGAPDYTGSRLRGLLGAFLSKPSTRPVGAFSGVPAGTPASIVTAVAAGLAWTVNPHTGVADVETSATAGPYQYLFDAVVNGTYNAAHASLDRIDLLSVQISDPVQDGSSVPAPSIVYTAGTAASSPTPPAVPVQSMALAQIRVPGGGGTPVVTFVAPVTVASGGIMPTANPANYPANPYVGQYADDASLGGLLRWNGTAWVNPDTDTGWVTSGVSAAGANTLSSVQVRRKGSLVQVEMTITLSAFYATALTSGVTGNITNTTVATITDTRFIPTHAGSLSSGPTGVMLTGSVQTDGSININALVPSITFAAGDQISVVGTYLVD